MPALCSRIRTRSAGKVWSLTRKSHRRLENADLLPLWARRWWETLPVLMVGQVGCTARTGVVLQLRRPVGRVKALPRQPLSSSFITTTNCLASTGFSPIFGVYAICMNVCFFFNILNIASNLVKFILLSLGYKNEHVKTAFFIGKYMGSNYSCPTKLYGGGGGLSEIA